MYLKTFPVVPFCASILRKPDVDNQGHLTVCFINMIPAQAALVGFLPVLRPLAEVKAAAVVISERRKNSILLVPSFPSFVIMHCSPCFLSSLRKEFEF